MEHSPHAPLLHPTRVGCAGWSLSSNVAPLFPAEGSHLERYAKVFSCVEINSSFYRSHQEKTYARWARSVPENFRFSVKMPRTVTHDSRLQGCEQLVADFLSEVAALGDKLGYLLVQLPPSLALDMNIAVRFFRTLRDLTRAPTACEPRHASWFTGEAQSLLQDADISTVWAHPSPVAGTDSVPQANQPYFRLHGAPQIYYSSYGDAFIEGVAASMHHVAAEGRDTWCIFDNTARGAAIPNALTLQAALNTAPGR